MPRTSWRKRIHQKKNQRNRKTVKPKPRCTQRNGNESTGSPELASSYQPGADTKTPGENNENVGDTPESSSQHADFDSNTGHGSTSNGSFQYDQMNSNTGNDSSFYYSHQQDKIEKNTVKGQRDLLYKEHSYHGLERSANKEKGPEFNETQSAGSIQPEISVEVMTDVKNKLEFLLPRCWMCVLATNVFHVLCTSAKGNLSIQRSLDVSVNGNVNLFVHGQPVSIVQFVSDLDPPIPLDKESESINYFVDRLAKIVKKVDMMEICSGYDTYEEAWETCPLGEIDRNQFKEYRYVETFRSFTCLRLVPYRKWRCSECLKLYGPLKRRAKAAAEVERHANAPNVYLTEQQKLHKLKEKQKELCNARRRLTYLRTCMQKVIEEQGVQIEDSMCDDLTEILRNADLTTAQEIFLQQQVKASQQKNSSGMRWHPTLIRLALSIYLTSPAAYETLRQTGMVKLPTSRTLFDYSHCKPVKEGVDGVVLQSVSERVAKLCEKHKKFHVLMADEMYISQTLVFQKSSGRLLGFTTLDTIDSEVKALEKYLDQPAQVVEEEQARKILVYMIKGVTNGIKEVIGTFAVGKTLSTNQLYTWTWQVIGLLERCGIAVICLVCDGASTNRAFIKKHIPATPDPTGNGVIFDTWNKAAPHRKLYFLSDVPHLLKTLRNCVLNSRWDGHKSRRRMMKNKKKISWDFVIKLFEAKKNKTLRKSFKLNAMNVYPDSYARMNVKYAGQFISNTVSKDMASQGWPEAEEMIIFLKKSNDWFDCLNGAHSSVAKKTRNPNLAPYTSKTDSRFKDLSDYLNYLDEWETEAKTCMDITNIDNSNLVDNCDESAIEEPGEEDDTPAGKRVPSTQTLEGIRMSTVAFQHLVGFMLDQGASFINARVFTQDPLEQHFSKVRAGQGGSNNPNLLQSLNRNRALHTIGELGMKRKRGNCGEGGASVEVTTKKLPKRDFRRVPKFCADL